MAAPTSCSESRGSSRLKPCGVGRGNPAWSRSVGRAGGEGGQPGWGGHGDSTGTALTVRPGHPEKPQPELQDVLQLLHLRDRQPVSPAGGAQHHWPCRGSAAPPDPARPPAPAAGAVRSPGLPGARPLTSTGPTCEATCATLSLEGESRVRVSRGARDCPPARGWEGPSPTAGLGTRQSRASARVAGTARSQGRAGASERMIRDAGRQMARGGERGGSSPGTSWHRAGDSPLQLHSAPQPVPGDNRLPRHVGVLRQEEMLGKAGQGLPPSNTQCRPASPSITPASPRIAPDLPSITPSLSQYRPASPSIAHCHPASPQHHPSIALHRPSIAPALSQYHSSGVSPSLEHSQQTLCRASTSHSRCSAEKRGRGWRWAAPRRPQRSRREPRAGRGGGRRAGAAGGPRATAPWDGPGRAPAAGGATAGLAGSPTGTASTCPRLPAGPHSCLGPACPVTALGWVQAGGTIRPALAMSCPAVSRLPCTPSPALPCPRYPDPHRSCIPPCPHPLHVPPLLHPAPCSVPPPSPSTSVPPRVPSVPQPVPPPSHPTWFHPMSHPSCVLSYPVSCLCPLPPAPTRGKKTATLLVLSWSGNRRGSWKAAEGSGCWGHNARAGAGTPR